MADNSRRSGQLIKRGENKWLVRVFLGLDETTGKRRYHNKTIRGPKKDAQMYLNDKLRELDLGIFVEPAAESLNTFLDKWLETTAKHRVSERTFNDYKSLMRRYVRNELGSIKLSNLHPRDIQELYSKMQGNGLSARVVRYTHSVLSSALKQAVQWGMLFRNPAELVNLPKQAKKEMHALSVEQVGMFLSALKGDRYEKLFAFAITTGMRPEEYFALQWKDVDFNRGTVTIQRVLIWKQSSEKKEGKRLWNKPGESKRWYFAEPKTAGSRRTIPLPATMAKLLMEHKRNQAEERLKLGIEYQNQDLVFATEWGTPISLQNLTRRHFKPALEEANLPKSIRLYDLRHTCATLLLAAGENPKIVSERLGHATIRLTLDTYSHVLPDMQKGAADKLESLVFAAT